MKTRVEKVPERKISAVKELTGLIKSKKTILIASVKNLPASQFQEISKKFRGKAEVKLTKKNLMLRAIKNSGNDDLEKIKKFIQDSVAVLFSDLDSFELAAELVQNKNPSKAKAGQIAEKDIEVEAGPTDLVPGPAISELGALGIQIQIDKGKINIKEPKVIVKQGQKISESAVGLMNKLGIKPFSVGFIPIAAFDFKEKKLYENINIDIESTIAKLKEYHTKALAFAVEIGYYSHDTIKLIIAKAGRNEIAISKIVNASENKSDSQKASEDLEKSSGESLKANEDSSESLGENKQ